MGKKHRAAPQMIHNREVIRDRMDREVIRDRMVAWRELVVLCRKCGGKLKGGFGDDGDCDLRSALRAAVRELGRRGDVRIVETGCFGVCPKRAVVALRGADPGRLLIVPQGHDAASVLRSLGVTGLGVAGLGVAGLGVTDPGVTDLGVTGAPVAGQAAGSGPSGGL